ncbi:MAG TPA: penicillin acylase family protein [Solirubrobacteraceae bacterium]|nr:penicillin acylase family protein [Solirubrobacteraceae bacterium]
MKRAAAAGARRALIAGLSAFALIASGAGAARADTPALGTNDAGGFRNVLPPGEAGVDNALQFAQFQANGQRPAHWDDQLPLYRDLVYASPHLTHAQIPSFFKDATFGVRPEDVASTESPRGDVTIVRDRQYGVPHIYGTTRAGAMFGEGYAGAEDRLFLIDILRHTGRAQLSSFAGGLAGNRAMDRTQWSLAPYTEADLQSQVDNAPRLYGARGQALIDDVNSFVAGINAFVDAATINPNLLPAEYAAFGKSPQHFTATDLIAEASLIGGIFGKGGGNELRSALTLQAFQQRFGAARGRAAWSDFREHNDPEAPTTLAQPFPYQTGSPFSPRGLALPDANSVSFTSFGPPVSSGGSRQHTSGPVQLPIPSDGSIGSQLLAAAATGHGLASNWELVSARRSGNGHAIAVMGPQVGYYVPQILLEEDVHGPGIDARGAAFPGVNLYVQLGHGRDYAWSATTATSDNVDTFAEVLCQDDSHYLYRGRCLPMEQLQNTNSWTPNASDKTPPGSETLSASRTVHGIVYARGTVAGRRVAFVSARTTYFHEADSALGFSELNDPGFVTSPERFQRAAADINFGFNWAYVDANHIAYYHSGAYPQRASGTSPDFPILGTGEFDWKGYDPALHTLETIPFAAHPHAVDPDYLVSWNNKQAPGWSSADDKYSFGPVYRSQMIEDGVRRALAGAGKMRIEQLVSAMDEPATQDIRGVYLWPIIRRVLGSPTDPKLTQAIALLDAWHAHGSHRRDLDKSGINDDNAAITLMDALWPKLLDAEFHPALGDGAFRALQGMLGFGAPVPGSQPGAPAFSDGWYGYVSKDLRDLLNPARTAACPKRRSSRRARRRARAICRPAARRRARPQRGRAQAVRRARRRPILRPRVTQTPVRGRYSRVYCGNGSLASCRRALQDSLSAALAVTPQAIYGRGDCASRPNSACFDQNRSVIASGIGMPPFPFQNRPTFQQVVELTQTLPR